MREFDTHLMKPLDKLSFINQYKAKVSEDSNQPGRKSERRHSKR